ncbi:MAG: chemotaxis protein CheW [Gemmatimonadaceae bacterium]
MELLVFQLDGARYALALDAVREVVRAVAVTPLPGAPDVVHGVIDVRGSVVPVFDLRARLGTTPREIDPDDQFVLANAGARVVALQVDRVEWMAEVDVTAVSADVARDTPHIAGVARLADGLVLIHDLETFLSESEVVALDDAMRAAGAGGAT